jgi:hypothetical protein
LLLYIYISKKCPRAEALGAIIHFAGRLSPSGHTLPCINLLIAEMKPDLSVTVIKKAGRNFKNFRRLTHTSTTLKNVSKLYSPSAVDLGQFFLEMTR